VLGIEQYSALQRAQSIHLHDKGQDVLNLHVSF